MSFLERFRRGNDQPEKDNSLDQQMYASRKQVKHRISRYGWQYNIPVFYTDNLPDFYTDSPSDLKSDNFPNEESRGKVARCLEERGYDPIEVNEVRNGVGAAFWTHLQWSRAFEDCTRGIGGRTLADRVNDIFSQPDVLEILIQMHLQYPELLPEDLRNITEEAVEAAKDGDESEQGEAIRSHISHLNRKSK